MSHPALPGPLQESPDFPVAFRASEPVSGIVDACVILQHGVGGDEMNLAPLARHLPAHCVGVLTRGPLVLGPGQFGWFRVGFGATGPRIDAAEAEGARLRLLEFVQAIQRYYDIRPTRTLLAGFSQGGIMSASVGLSAPERVAGFAILSGRILPELAPQLAPRERLARLRAYISHGEADGTLPFAWAERAQAWLAELGVPHELHRYAAAGHELTPAMQADFLAWAGEVLA